MAKTSLRIQQLSTGYQQMVVKNVELDIPDGKLTALIGPNGCGKSTLLKCMARILKPMGGHVLLNQQPIHSTPTKEVAKQLALLPQGPVAPEGLIVRELVAQGRYPHQSLLKQWSKADEAAVQKAMQMTDTLALADRPVSALSGGQRQRCWIAMVLAQDTPIILLDEPTTFLDMRVQVDLLNLLISLAHEHGRTLVVVLHELNLAAAFADHLVLMKDGELQAQGCPEDVFTSDNLKSVFNLDANIIRDPHSQRLMCVPTNMPAGAAVQNAPLAQAV
ncbi:ABC transporter ATP-binding protein [Salinibius halmophilus]|uniref:ABC transporter ATP-binding protein n=1 Tax=Salinibius halmophilus TaxID=1853216 RepID=UPI000E6650F2|nr:ABC transporter ATP-binding protein [Salinibius halmophilus]